MSEKAVAKFEGKCAFWVSVRPSRKAPPGRSWHILARGRRMYLFSGAVPKWLFRLIPGSAGRADRNWIRAHS